MRVKLLTLGERIEWLTNTWRKRTSRQCIGRRACARCGTICRRLLVNVQRSFDAAKGTRPEPSRRIGVSEHSINSAFFCYYSRQPFLSRQVVAQLHESTTQRSLHMAKWVIVTKIIWCFASNVPQLNGKNLHLLSFNLSKLSPSKFSRSWGLLAG